MACLLMKKIFLILLFICSFHRIYPNNLKIDALFHSLDPYSIAEFFAFYHLYKGTEQGEKALAKGWELLNAHREVYRQLQGNLTLPDLDIDAIISLVNKTSTENPIPLSEEQLEIIESLSDHLANRKLKGFTLWDKELLPTLPSEEIDLARSLLLYQFEENENWKQEIRQYEASIDLMSLQILARLPKNASSEEKIHAINQFIFYEKRFRFPPHSLWVNDIDLYTFLPSVLDSRKGVCLGVSILYLSIAQRLDLPLEIITPPGHIYISYVDQDKTINIETTARGISLPSKSYLGINTYQLQKRIMKEVIGLSLINQASVSWHRENYEITVSLYEQARIFLPDDPLLKMLLGYNYLFLGKIDEGKALLNEIKNLPFEGAIYKETTPEDYLNGKIDIEGIKTIFLNVNETRDSILKKQEQIKGILKKYPAFRDGLLQLAVTYLQLNRGGEALEALSQYHKIDSNNPTVEYYLTLLCADRFRYQKAWEHYKLVEKIISKKNHFPDFLKKLKLQLRTLYPDPEDIPQLAIKRLPKKRTMHYVSV